MNAKKIIGCITGILFVIASIIDFVFTCTSFKDVENVTTQYGLQGFMQTLLVFELIFSFVIFVVSIITVYKTATENFDFDEGPLSTLMGVNLVLAILLHVGADMAVGYENWLNNKIKTSNQYFYEVPASAVVVIVLTAIAILVLLVATFYNSNTTTKKILGGLGIICLLVIYIIAFCNGGTAMATVINIFLFICLLLSGVFIFLPDNSIPARRTHTAYTSTTSSYSTVHPAPQPSSQPKETKDKDEDPIKKLKELKELLDSNIITQEEYEEKRKKYLDKI